MKVDQHNYRKQSMNDPKDRRTIVANTLREIATWCDEDRSPTELEALAQRVERDDGYLSCPVCQEDPCDKGCPLEPLRNDSDPSSTYIEWRVTADQTNPDPAFPPYDFTWSKRINPHLGDPEHAARAFVQQCAVHQQLTNIKIYRRTVTIGPWEDRTALLADQDQYRTGPQSRETREEQQ